MEMKEIKDLVKELRRVKASELIPNEKNWRLHPDEQQQAMQGALEEIGIAGPVLAYETPQGLKLIDGHLRAELMGDKPIPVVVLECSDEVAAKVLATYDPMSGKAETDPVKLKELLAELEFESSALQEMAEDLEKEAVVLPTPGNGGDDFDATPATDGPTRTQVGDLWLIGGKHRLLVGDCTVKENVDRLMGGEQVGLCFTSPPYAQQRDYGELAKEKCQDWHALMCGAFAHLPMTDDGQVLVNLGLIHREGEWIPYWQEWIEWMRQQGWKRFGWYVWDQGWGLPGDWNGRLAPSYEFVFHFNKEAVKPQKWIDSKLAGQTTKGKKGLRGSDGKVSSFGHAVGPDATYTYPENKIPDSVIREYRQCGSVGHPAPYSANFAEFILKCWPRDVYDPFMGSWTTGIAAHRLGKRSFGMELEPKFVDVCLKRAEAEGLTVEKL